eukprot:GHVS01033379.1.p2 GENE.GHVS01033379.1~~GHVS01033379.1.p2  ORF type:complete len:121 (-),score=11.06 GHVS01033379.1:710-1072(-)
MNSLRPTCFVVVFLCLIGHVASAKGIGGSLAEVSMAEKKTLQPLLHATVAEVQAIGNTGQALLRGVSMDSLGSALRDDLSITGGASQGTDAIKKQEMLDPFTLFSILVKLAAKITPIPIS